MCSLNVLNNTETLLSPQHSKINSALTFLATSILKILSSSPLEWTCTPAVVIRPAAQEAPGPTTWWKRFFFSFFAFRDDVTLRQQTMACLRRSSVPITELPGPGEEQGQQKSHEWDGDPEITIGKASPLPPPPPPLNPLLPPPHRPSSRQPLFKQHNRTIKAPLPFPSLFNFCRLS